MTSSGVLLGAYPAKQCARRTHNDFDPAIAAPDALPETVLARMEAGRRFEDDLIVPALVQELGHRCVSIPYGDHRGDKANRIAATTAAMDAGVEVIIGAQLPDDVEGSRTGSPDLLIRAGVDEGRARYVPADIKHHMTLKPAKTATVTVSGFGDGFVLRKVSGVTASTTYRADDALQLAHYTRMLQAIDRHPGPDLAVGAILGTSDFVALTGDRFGFVWYDLASLTERTWSSNEQGSAMRSVLDIYDYEFGLRVRVAQAARHGDEPLVRPFGKAECAQCPYATVCRQEAGPVDVSFVVNKGQLTDREWRYLYGAGFGTINALSSLDLSGETAAGFVAASAPLPTPHRRLADAVGRARMVRDNIMFVRSAKAPVEVPAADVEIDFDVEWHAVDQHVYQWGARVRYNGDEATATYEHTAVSFEVLDEDSAAALAHEFFNWMETFIADHEAQGRTVGVYHWTKPETRHAARVLGPKRSDRLFARRFVDLHAFMQRHYTSRDGFGLKTVAPVFGFSWGADDAGGDLSTTKIDEARHHPDPLVREAAKAWLLTYNHDDCAAQAAVRDGLKTYAAARVIPGPGPVPV